MFANRRNLAVAVVGLALVAALILVVMTWSGGPQSASTSTTLAGSGASGSSTSAPSTAPGVSSEATTVAPGQPETEPDPGTGAPVPTAPVITVEADDVGTEAFVEPVVELPSVVSVSSTSDLSDGQEVTVHVVPEAGSLVYGVEARLCRAGTVIEYDFDMRPTEGGNCILEPLSARSDKHINVLGSPPFDSVDLTFRAGVGTNSFATDDGRPVTITCGPGSPCVLALKVQVPNGYGFKTYDVTYR